MKNASNKGKKVVVGLSGGVDSAVSAYLLLEQGYDVVGVFMQCWDAKADGCKSDEDKAYAIETASKLGIKFEHMDFRKEYKEKVMAYFYSEYKLGRTPNPDVMCNKEIKFGLFYNWAMQNGFDYVATGHYARVEKYYGEQGESSALVDLACDVSQFKLLSGIDPSKDQSYFLYTLTAEKLAHILFPIGGMVKTEVRALAENIDLPPAKRPDSVGICFIGEVNIRDFLKKSIEPRVGDVELVSGEKIGTHEGVWFYTIGQRHGFNVSKYVGIPLYVVTKDIVRNVLIVGESASVNVRDFNVEDLSFISDAEKALLKSKDNCEVRIRHLGKLYSALVSFTDTNILSVKVNEDIFGIASGQSAVLYHKSQVLGGGIIC